MKSILVQELGIRESYGLSAVLATFSGVMLLYHWIHMTQSSGFEGKLNSFDSTRKCWMKLSKGWAEPLQQFLSSPLKLDPQCVSGSSCLCHSTLLLAFLAYLIQLRLSVFISGLSSTFLEKSYWIAELWLQGDDTLTDTSYRKNFYAPVVGGIMFEKKTLSGENPKKCNFLTRAATSYHICLWIFS